MRILVLGGTGLAGRCVAAEAGARGHQVRVLARRRPAVAPAEGIELHRGDVLTGDGLPTAMDGMDSVIDCMNIETVRGSRARQFFTTAVQHAAPAAGRAEVGSYILLSIVGVGHFPLGYYEAKAEQERTLLALTEGSSTRVTIARTTQFHDFAAQTLARSSAGPIAFIPSMRIKPVDLRAVARHLVSLAEAGPVGLAPELSGPEVESLTGMVRRIVRATGRRSAVIPVPLAGRARRANQDGVLIPSDGIVDRVSFDEWLARRVETGAQRG